MRKWKFKVLKIITKGAYSHDISKIKMFKPSSKILILNVHPHSLGLLLRSISPILLTSIYLHYQEMVSHRVLVEKMFCFLHFLSREKKSYWIMTIFITQNRTQVYKLRDRDVTGDTQTTDSPRFRSQIFRKSHIILHIKLL